MNADAARAAVVNGWWDYHRRSIGQRSERKDLAIGQPPSAIDSRQAVDDLLTVGGADAVAMVVALVAAAEDDAELAYVGAGPVEDLLQFHAQDLGTAIADEARRSPRFAQALRSVLVDRSTAPADLQAWLC